MNPGPFELPRSIARISLQQRASNHSVIVRIVSILLKIEYEETGENRRTIRKIDFDVEKFLNRWAPIAIFFFKASFHSERNNNRRLEFCGCTSRFYRRS